MRHPQWEERLSSYLASVRHEPHAYGQHDCMIHSGRVVEAVTGEDLFSIHKGQYKDKKSALAYLKRLGFKSADKMIDHYLKEVPIGFAQRGDLVLTPGGIPAVCIGSEAMMVGADDNVEGLVPVLRSRWLKAWKVGRE